jgi:exopolysaccharide production protein ExoZ
MSRPNSILSIQVLRAIAALAVVGGHIIGEFTSKLELTPNVLGFQSLGAGVDLFFVVSGFVMVYASERLFATLGGPRRFFLRRLIRIVPIYWLFCIIEVSYFLLHYGGLKEIGASPAWIAASFAFLPYARFDGLMAPVVGVGWTLNYEMFFYAVFAVAVALPRERAVAAVTGILAVLVVIGAAPVPMPAFLAYWSSPIVLEFVAGMWIALAVRHGYRLPLWLAACLVALAVVLLVDCDTLGIGFPPAGSLMRVVAWGLPAALVVASVTLSSGGVGGSLLWSVLGKLGDASYALYLVHPLAIVVPRLFVRAVAGPTAEPWRTFPLLYSGVLMACAVVAAFLLHVTVERPVTIWLRALLPLPARASASTAV